MVWIWFASLRILQRFCTPQKMVGMNLCVSFPCTIINTCDTSRAIMTGLSHLACVLERSASYLAPWIGLCYFGIKELKSVRPAVAYDDQGLVFAIAFGGFIRMFDARKYEKGPFDIFSVGGDISDANVVKFSNDGRLMLLTTMDGHIHVLDSFHGTLLSTHNVKPVSCNSTLEASFSPEGMFVLSGSGDGSVYAWNIRTGKEVACWLSSEKEPPVIKWAPGSLTFATGSSELSFWIPDLSKLGSFVGAK